MKYIKYFLLFLWLGGCIVGAGYHSEKINFSGIGFISLICLLIFNDLDLFVNKKEKK